MEQSLDDLVPGFTTGWLAERKTECPSDVTIGSRRQRSIVAFDTGGLGSGDVHQALTGGSI